VQCCTGIAAVVLHAIYRAVRHVQRYANVVFVVLCDKAIQLKSLVHGLQWCITWAAVYLKRCAATALFTLAFAGGITLLGHFLVIQRNGRKDLGFVFQFSFRHLSHRFGWRLL